MSSVPKGTEAVRGRAALLFLRRSAIRRGGVVLFRLPEGHRFVAYGTCSISWLVP
jgi:hypothetical protein